MPQSERFYPFPQKITNWGSANMGEYLKWQSLLDNYLTFPYYSSTWIQSSVGQMVLYISTSKCGLRNPFHGGNILVMPHACWLSSMSTVLLSAKAQAKAWAESQSFRPQGFRPNLTKKQGLKDGELCSVCDNGILPMLHEQFWNLIVGQYNTNSKLAELKSSTDP